MRTAVYHLPGLFEFYELYKRFLPLFFEHRDYFYDWVTIGSIYGAPTNSIWGGGRIEIEEADAEDVIKLLKQYGISPRFTFSNLLLKEEHLTDAISNRLCEKFISCNEFNTGVIVASDLLLDYLKTKYTKFYFVSSTTKVVTDLSGLGRELKRSEFSYIVPDFRHNKNFEYWNKLEISDKKRIEFLCNECCDAGCVNRKACYENVSRKILGETLLDYPCKSKNAEEGYVFSKAMQNPMFIGVKDIVNRYLPAGFSNFKIEGRSLGSAVVLEMLIYYMVKPECSIKVREAIYLDSMLDLF